jgi:hypothetical protein
MGNWGNVYILTTSGVEYFKLTTSGEDADWAENNHRQLTAGRSVVLKTCNLNSRRSNAELMR